MLLVRFARLPKPNFEGLGMFLAFSLAEKSILLIYHASQNIQLVKLSLPCFSLLGQPVNGERRVNEEK